MKKFQGDVNNSVSLHSVVVTFHVSLHGLVHESTHIWEGWVFAQMLSNSWPLSVGCLSVWPQLPESVELELGF